MSFESVYEQHFAPLFRYVHRWTGDSDAAEDVVQEAFVRYLLSGVPEHEARPWLFRVAGNLLRDDRRRRMRRRGLVVKWAWWRSEEAEEGSGAAGAVETTRVGEALDRLHERDRTMLLMREEGFSYREIAEVVGVAPGSVGTLLARALGRFKEAYERG